MNSNNFTPPAAPSAQAIESLFALLAVVSNPAAVKARTDALVAQTKAATDACSELEIERKRLIDENARSADLRAKENLLANKEAAQQKAALLLANSSEALAERDRTLTRKEAEFAQRERQLNEKELAHVRRVEQAKAALG